MAKIILISIYYTIYYFSIILYSNCLFFVLYFFQVGVHQMILWSWTSSYGINFQDTSHLTNLIDERIFIFKHKPKLNGHS